MIVIIVRMFFLNVRITGACRLLDVGKGDAVQVTIRRI